MSKIIVVTAEELEDIIRKVVREELKIAEQPAWLTSKEAAVFLGASNTKFSQMVNTNPNFPKPSAIGRVKRYLRSELETFRTNNRR